MTNIQNAIVDWPFSHIPYAFPCVCFDSTETWLFPTSLGQLLTNRPAIRYAILPRQILYVDGYRVALPRLISIPLSWIVRARVSSF
jgi:hypothetical protein